MLQTEKTSLSKKCILEGAWDFNEKDGNALADSAGNKHKLNATGLPKFFNEGHSNSISGVKLDGVTAWLSSINPVVLTDKSYSIVAWVRLDSDLLNNKLALKPKEHALTAVSQDSPTHSAFYLGVRQIQESLPNGSVQTSLKWNFTIAPIDGSETGPIEWQHAHVRTALNDSALDKWVMLVGVCDVEQRSAYIYVPNLGESGKVIVPNEWVFWKAKGGFQVGRSLWLGRNVDQWPGSISRVRAFSGVLTEEDAKMLYLKDSILYST